MSALLVIAALLLGANAGEAIALAPRIGFPSRFPLGGEPARRLSRVVVETVEWRAGEGRGRLSVRLVFSAPVAGAGAEGARDGWLRAVDEAGLAQQLSPPRGWLDRAGDASQIEAVFQADLPGAPRRLRLLVGPPAQLEGAVAIDLERRTASSMEPVRELPSLSWPELERTAASQVPGALLVAPRLRIELAPVAQALDRECLKDVELAIPALHVEKREDGARRLFLARVIVNRGKKLACEVPKEVWFASEDGEVVQPPAYLAGAPAFASYLDAISFDLPSATSRGQLFIGERRATGTMEIVAQLRVDLEKKLVQRVQDVEVRVVDPQDATPIANAELELRGQSDWRPDRSVVQKGKTGPDGRFRFVRVEPGAWTVGVRAERHRELEQKLVQGFAEAARVEVRLVPPPVTPGYIGVFLENGSEGLLVREVVIHGGADRAGIRSGDRLLSANGLPLKNVMTSRSLITGAPGSFVTLEVRRGGQTLMLKVQRAAGRAP